MQLGNTACLWKIGLFNFPIEDWTPLVHTTVSYSEGLEWECRGEKQLNSLVHGSGYRCGPLGLHVNRAVVYTVHYTVCSIVCTILCVQCSVCFTTCAVQCALCCVYSAVLIHYMCSTLSLQDCLNFCANLYLHWLPGSTTAKVSWSKLCTEMHWNELKPQWYNLVSKVLYGSTQTNLINQSIVLGRGGGIKGRRRN